MTEKSGGPGGGPKHLENLDYARKLLKSLQEREVTTKSDFRGETTRKVLQIFAITGILALPPGMATAWVWGGVKTEVTKSVKNAADKAVGIESRAVVEKRIADLDNELAEIDRIRQLRLSGNYGQWIRERIKEGSARIKRSVDNRTFNAESEKGLKVQRDKLKQILDAHDNLKEEIKSVETIISIVDYLTHWAAWWGSFLTIGLGFFQTRRMRDIKIAGETDTQNIASAVSVLMEEQKINREQAEQAIKIILLAQGQFVRLGGELAKWEGMYKVGQTPTLDDVKVLRKLMGLNEGLVDVVEGDDKRESSEGKGDGLRGLVKRWTE